MAEGGGLSRSIQGGSDADFEFQCTPCSDDGSRKEATKYCPECEEYLCTVCTKCHLRFAATRNHPLTDPVIQQESGTRTSSESKCSLHPGREIEMYCGSHDMVYCALCIAKDHRLCDGVCEVREAARSRNSNHSSLQDKIDSLQRELALAKEEKSGSIRRHEKDKREYLSQVKQTGETIIAKIRALMKEASTNVEMTYKKTEEGLQADDMAISTVMEDLDKCKDQVISSRNLNQTQVFVQDKLQTSVLSNIEVVLKGMKEKKPMRMTYVENGELTYQVTAATFLAKIVEKPTDDNPRKNPLRIKSKKEINVQESGDVETCNIVGICQLPNGTIILADYSNKKLKRLDSDYNVKDHCVFDEGVCGVCCSGISEVAVKTGGEIVLVHVGVSMTRTSSFDFIGELKLGMSFYKDEFWVFTGNGINIYNKTGVLLKSLANTFLQTTLKTFHQVYPAGVDNSTIFLSDVGHTVVGLDEKGAVIKTLSDERLQCIMAVCPFTDGTLFLAGTQSCNILMFSSDGTCLGELIKDDKNLSYLRGMCLDIKRKTLLAAGNNDNVLVMELVD